MTWDDFTVLYGNSEAFKPKYFFELSNQLRALQVSMSIHASTGSNGDYYICFVWIYDWKTYLHIFAALDNLLITG